MSFLNLLSAIPSLITQFRGTEENPAEKYAQQMMAQQQGLAGEITNMARARTDPNNPMYQALYKEERGRGQQDLARVIAEAQAQNRMATRLGRTPLFDPARGGETQFRALMGNYGDVQSKARESAMGQLDKNISALSTGYDAYGNLAKSSLGMLAPYQDTRQRRNLAMELGGYQGIGDLLSKMGSAGGMKQRQYLPGGEYIDWDSQRYQR